MPFHTLTIAPKSRHVLTPSVLSPQKTASLLGSTEPNSPDDGGASPLSELPESRGASPLSVPDVDETPTGEERLAVLEAERRFNPYREKTLREIADENERRFRQEEAALDQFFPRPSLLPPLSSFAHTVAKPVPKPTAVAAGAMPSLEREGWFYKKFKGVIYRLVPKRHGITNAITGFTLYPKDGFDRILGHAAAKDGAPAPPVQLFGDPEAKGLA